MTNPQVKPKWHLPLGVMEGIVTYNCRKYNFPRPVMIHPFWEGAGDTIYDYSGNRNHAQMVSGSKPSWTVNNNGITTKYYNNEYIISDYSTPLSSNCTLFVMAACNVYVPNYETVYNYKTETNTDLIGIFFNDTLHSIHWWAGDSSGIDSPTGVWNVDETQIYTITRNSNNDAYLYINGTEIDSASKTWTTGITPVMRWGQYAGDGLTLNGTISISGLWNEELTPSQVKFLSNNPFFMFQVSEELYDYIKLIEAMRYRMIISDEQDYTIEVQ